MIRAMMLFGSASRGDSGFDSDVDMLAVTDGGRPSSTKEREIEVQFLPEDELISLAKSGDLFALHLAFEGTVIFDRGLIFNRFKESIVIRDDYEDLRSNALDLCWFLFLFGGNFVHANRLVNKRIAWCVRTVLISKLVEAGKFVFSPKGLVENFPRDYIEYLINLRRSDDGSAKRLINVKKFLNKFDRRSKLSQNKKKDMEYFQYIFEMKGNDIAISTLKSLYDISDDKVYI